ncbi:ion transporter [Marivirga sp.]|uniref:ion transporter n=1 Tax=Marivirga sp. TaxID=2018662 RepID=UPI0025D6600E|nr:ion transporter [Marivirga sp.]
MKDKLFKILQRGSHDSKQNLAFDYFIFTLILLNVITLVLESVDEIYSQYNEILVNFNVFCVIIFSIEYLLRLFVSDLSHPSKSRLKSAIKFMLSPFGIIDLLAILPFYLPMLIKIDLRFIRIIRLVRVVRIFKLNRYNNSLKLIGTVIKEKKEELLITGFVTFLTLLLASFLMYAIESEHQPEAFLDILASFWWAVATLTTVGYGDVYPITSLGRFIAGIIALMGIGIIALPTGIISAGFMNKLGKKNEDNKCPHCGKSIN